MKSSKILTVITALFILISAVSCNLDIPGYFSADASSARLLVIGMDYANSQAASYLSGTMNDAYDIAAVFSEIMGRKNVQLETEYLIQEGHEILFEVKCLQYATATAERVMTILENTAPTPSGIEKYYSDGECIVRAFVDSEKTAATVKYSIETELKDAVSIQFASIRNSSHYPSSSNILKVVQDASDLEENELFIVYYTGHGISFNSIPDSVFEKIIRKYLDNGSLTQEQFDTLNNLTIKSATEINITLDKLAVPEEPYNSIVLDCNTYLKKYSNLKGAFITAPYYDWEYYGLLEMATLYKELCRLKCKVVLIVDACYSGFANAGTFGGVTLAESFSSFMQSEDYPNVVVLSASAKSETSKIAAVMTMENDIQRHSMFTKEILSELGWKHSSVFKSYISVPRVTINEDGTLAEDETYLRTIDGYLEKTPSRITATDLFDNVIKGWQGIEQTPERNVSGYEICIVP